MKSLNRCGFAPQKDRFTQPRSPQFYHRSIVAFVLVAIGLLFAAPDLGSVENTALSRLGLARVAHANSSYVNLASVNLVFRIDATTTNLITSNDDWTNVSGVEGYFGRNLTATHGVDPRTVTGTEFPSNAVPAAGQVHVNANKGNPSAFNAGGVAEFDSGSHLAVGLQGNVQANPYLIFYLNTTGVGPVYINYQVKDIDSGANNSASPMALQYRVGETGAFTNIPAGYIADATQGPNLSGLTNNIAATLPAAAWNQPRVQVRIITTNAADSTGGSTPDEWIGVNNVRISSLAPSAGGVVVGGRVRTFDGIPVAKSTVTMSDGSGNIRTAISNAFGYYSFTEVPAGGTYFFGIRSRRFTFITKYPVFTANEDFNGLDFVAY